MPDSIIENYGTAVFASGKIRKGCGGFRLLILTIEQFNNKDFAKLYSCQYVDEPLSYQKTLFQLLVANGNLMACDVDIMTLQFFSPIFSQ